MRLKKEDTTQKNSDRKCQDEIWAEFQGATDSNWNNRIEEHMKEDCQKNEVPKKQTV